MATKETRLSKAVAQANRRPVCIWIPNRTPLRLWDKRANIVVGLRRSHTDKAATRLRFTFLFFYLFIFWGLHLGRGDGEQSTGVTGLVGSPHSRDPSQASGGIVDTLSCGCWSSDTLVQRVAAAVEERPILEWRTTRPGFPCFPQKPGAGISFLVCFFLFFNSCCFGWRSHFTAQRNKDYTGSTSQ